VPVYATVTLQVQESGRVEGSTLNESVTLQVQESGYFTGEGSTLQGQVYVLFKITVLPIPISPVQFQVSLSAPHSKYQVQLQIPIFDAVQCPVQAYAIYFI
jgi:hypothetical protein